jgi:hypothetical protein
MDQPQAPLLREPTRRRRRNATGALSRGPSGRLRRLFVAPVVIGLALAAAACDGGSPKASVARLSATTTTVPPEAVATGGPSDREFVRYAACMRSHGVLNFPDDPASPAIRALKESGAMSSPKFQSAVGACAKYAHHGTPPPQVTTADQADYLKAAVCMRNHGIAGFPDPVFSSGNVNFPIPQSMNTNSTPFRRAREVCEVLIPAGLPYGKEAESGQ